MAERDLIEHLVSVVGEAHESWLDVGIGDDAAVITAPGRGELAVTTDLLVEGVHFAAQTSLALAGRKAVARALSDLAAMAARPLCSLAAVHFGRASTGADARELLEAVARTCDEFSAPLIGGDTAAGGASLCVCVTALGTPGPGGFARRSGARAGDAVCVTGALGGSSGGHHLRFTPRIAEALALAAECDLHALIDVSDGLSTDALHIAEASGVGLTLWARYVPVSGEAMALAGGDRQQALRRALDDGEDYELLFCLPPRQARLLAGRGVLGLSVSLIGEVTRDRDSLLVMPDGDSVPLRPGGWEHLL
jgi:thiamine-monophosphate kinase